MSTVAETCPTCGGIQMERYRVDGEVTAAQCMNGHTWGKSRKDRGAMAWMRRLWRAQLQRDRG